ncbi:hypothetical protein ACOMHN_006963 [Nucella lapillus]
MEQTTNVDSDITYPYYFYNLPGGETITGGLEDIVQWMEDNEYLLEDPKHHPGKDDYRKTYPGFLDDDATGDGEAEVYHDSSHLRGFVYSANIGTVITVGNIFFNLLLIILVVSRKSLRGQFVYQQVLNLALTDLAFSVVVDPFSVYFELQPWRLARGFCVAWMMLDAALPFVSFLLLLLLNLDRLFFAVYPVSYRRMSRRVGFRLLVLFLPWVIGLGVMLPLWLFTAVVWPQLEICMYGITKRAAVVSACLSLYLPCVLLIVLTVLVLVTLIGGMPQDSPDMSWQQLHVLGGGGGGAARGSRNAHVRVFLGGTNHNSSTTTTTITTNSNSARLTHDNSLDSTGSGVGGGGGRGREWSQDGDSFETRQDHRGMAVALCALNLLTVITQLPYGAISLLEPQCVEPECSSTIKLLQSLSWIRSCTFTLHPLLLVLLLRQVRLTCCRLCRGRHLPDSVGRGQGVGASGMSGTTSGNTKTDNEELTSMQNNDLDTAAQDKHSSTML